MPSGVAKFSYAFAVLVALVAVRMGTHNWLTVRPRLPEDYPEPEEIEVREVPVQYYDNLTHLTGFIQDFVVLRSRKPFYAGDLKEMFADEVVRAKPLNFSCTRETTVCAPCYNSPFAKSSLNFTTIGEVLEPGSGLYASFAKVSNSAANRLWSLMGASFPVNNRSLEHAFISNLHQSMITAPWHAASPFLSMSVQLLGRKTWLFVERNEYLNGWGGLVAAGVVLTTKSPKQKLTLYVYTSEPGDVLFFPATYAHTVYTHKGPNLMMNFRKLVFEAFYGQPVTFLQGILSAAANKYYELLRGTMRKRHAEDKAPELQPEQLYNSVAYHKIENACNMRGGQAVPLDAKLVQILKERTAKYE